MKETQSQDRHRFILGNPQGEENPTKLPLYKMYKIKTPKQVILLLAGMSLSLSYVQYTSVSLCSNEEHNSSICTLSVT